MKKKYCIRFNGFTGGLWLGTWLGDRLSQFSMNARRFGSRGEAKRYGRKVLREGKNQHCARAVSICEMQGNLPLYLKTLPLEVFCGN